MSALRPDLMMRCVIPVIMAGIIAVSIFARSVHHGDTDVRLARSTVSSCLFLFPATVRALACLYERLYSCTRSGDGDDAVPRLCPARRWPLGRSRWSCCRVRYWYRWRRRCTGYRAAAASVRRNGTSRTCSCRNAGLTGFRLDPYSHLRRSLGSVRSHCCAHYELAGWRCRQHRGYPSIALSFNY